VGVAFTTAWYGLLERGALRLGDRVLVTGAAGSVGTAAVQIARWAGLSRVGALVFNDGEAETARRYGATLSVSDPARLLKVDAHEQPTLCLDTVGGQLLDDIVHAMGPEGRIVNISTSRDGLVTFSLCDFYRRRLTLRGLATGTYDSVRGAEVLEILGEGFASDALQAPEIAATFPLAHAPDACALMSTHPAGKVVLTMPRAQVPT
jgi:NADPH:quinone reductase